MLHPCRNGPPTFSFSLATISPGPLDSVDSDTPDHSTRILDRHTPLCATLSLGRMDCPRLNDTYPGQWYSHVCYAENFGQQKGSQEADC